MFVNFSHCKFSSFLYSSLSFISFVWDDKYFQMLPMSLVSISVEIDDFALDIPVCTTYLEAISIRFCRFVRVMASFCLSIFLFFLPFMILDNKRDLSQIFLSRLKRLLSLLRVYRQLFCNIDFFNHFYYSNMLLHLK